MISSSSLVVIFKVEWEGFTSPQRTYDITRNTELNMAGAPFLYKTPFIDCHKLLKKIKVELKYFKLMNSFSGYSNKVFSPLTPSVKSVVNEKNGYSLCNKHSFVGNMLSQLLLAKFCYKTNSCFWQKYGNPERQVTKNKTKKLVINFFFFFLFVCFCKNKFRSKKAEVHYYLIF